MKKSIKAWGFVNKRGDIVSWFNDPSGGLAILKFKKHAVQSEYKGGIATGDGMPPVPVTISYTIPKKKKK